MQTQPTQAAELVGFGFFKEEKEGKAVSSACMAHVILVLW